MSNVIRFVIPGRAVFFTPSWDGPSVTLSEGRPRIPSSTDGRFGTGRVEFPSEAGELLTLPVRAWLSILPGVAEPNVFQDGPL